MDKIEKRKYSFIRMNMKEKKNQAEFQLMRNVNKMTYLMNELDLLKSCKLLYFF